MSEGKGQIRGIDFADPQNQFRDLNASLDKQETDSQSKWPGRVLVDDQLRRQFTADIVHDLESIISPHGFTKKLPTNAAWRIEQGMIEGCKQIVIDLKGRPFSQGIFERLVALKAWH
jgi:hypothetical protein